MFQVVALDVSGSVLFGGGSVVEDDSIHVVD